MAVRRTLRAVLAGLVLAPAALTAACTSAPAPRPAARPSAAVVVTSFNFTESAVLAEIYAQSLEHAGVPVRREPDLGPRELVAPALRQGLVDVVPEYLGTALLAARPGAPTTPAPAALGTLRQALAPQHLRVLAPSAAQDQNGFAVTVATAQRWHLRTLSDLRAVAPRLVLGGPAECPRRPLCLIGLRRVYGLRFARFDAYDDAALRATALDQGVIDVEVTFTTDPRLADGSLVLLRDDRRLQPDESVVPVVSDRAVARYGARLTRALDAVSARLNSRALTFLDWRVETAGGTVAGEARAWLHRHGLVTR